MKRTALLAGLDEVERKQIEELRRAAALILPDDAPSAVFSRLLADTHKCLLAAFQAGAFEHDDADLLPEGLKPMEALRRIEELKQHYAAQLAEGSADCDGSA